MSQTTVNQHGITDDEIEDDEETTAFKTALEAKDVYTPGVKWR